MNKSITLEVTGEQKIVCEGCEERVQGIIKTLQGVSKVRAHARTQRIEVLLDMSVLEPSAIVEKLSKAGYEAKVSSSV